MQSSDFPGIVSPVGAGALTRVRKKAKGGGVKNPTPHHLLIILMPHPEVSGALGKSAGIAAPRSRAR